MKLNDTINVRGYRQKGIQVYLLLECSFKEAVALDGQDLILSDDFGPKFTFKGYALGSVERASEDSTNVRFFKKLEPSIQSAIEEVESNVSNLRLRVDSTGSTATSAYSTASEAKVDIVSLRSELEAYGDAIDEMATQVFAEV